MTNLDWNAVEAWFRSHNIYRIFITIGAVEVNQSADALKGEGE